MMNLLDCGYIPKLLIASVLFPFTCTPIFRWFPVARPVMADISSKNERPLFLMPPHLNKQKSRLSFGRRQNNTFSYFLLLLQTMYTTWWSTATLSSISSARFVCLSSIANHEQYLTGVVTDCHFETYPQKSYICFTSNGQEYRIEGSLGQEG